MNVHLKQFAADFLSFGWNYFDCIAISVTRLGDLLEFGQLFKAFGNNKFAEISHINWQFL